MKTLLFVLSSTLTLAASAATVDDLKVDCHGGVVVLSTSDPGFSPYRPPHGRAPEFPARGWFKAKLQIKPAPESAGCSTVASKYGVDLSNLELEGQVNVASPTSLEATKTSAATSVGMLVPFTLHQRFEYVRAGKYLPLFPAAHGETMFLSGPVPGAGTFSVTVPISLEKAYGTTPSSKKPDAERLALAERVARLLVPEPHSYGLGGGDDLIQLLLALEPQGTAAKHAYAMQLWKLFDLVREATPFTHVFQFHVGGEGFFQGRPLALKLNALSHVPGVLTEKEELALVTAYPTLFLGGFRGTECPSVSERGIESFLAATDEALPHLTDARRYELRDVVHRVLQPVLSCFEGKVTAKAADIADGIRKSIDPTP